MIEWSEYAIEMETNIGSRHQQETFPILTRLCTLRGLIEKETNNDPAVLVIAKGIDADLIEWADKSPSCFKYTRVLSNDAENVPSGYYHVYPNVWVVSTWNLYRSARILTHEVIERCLSRNFASDFAQIRQSEAVLSMMNADICASVPCVFGQIDASGLQIGSSRSARAGTGTWILWPLYLAATMDRAMPTTRSWVLDQLDKMGRTMGIQQAISLAAVLRTQKEITAWDRFGSRVDEEVDDW
jgi:Tfp pilus assembly protein PilW